jgi:glucose-1-phosphate thymidylyltransferase
MRTWVAHLGSNTYARYVEGVIAELDVPNQSAS